LVAACYGAGIATYWWLRPTPIDAPRQEFVQAPPVPESIQPKVVQVRLEPPDRIERWAALATGERRVDLYRKAGDGFLERGDELSALRCYRRSLDSTRPADLAIRPQEDSWLLMSLKIARQKEMTDVRN
jgi:hypothetical protein